MYSEDNEINFHSFTVEWTIKNVFPKGIKTGVAILSPFFTAASVHLIKSSLNWQLAIYPEGICEKSKNFVSVCLFCKGLDTNSEIDVSYQLFFFNSEKQQLHKTQIQTKCFNNEFIHNRLDHQSQVFENKLLIDPQLIILLKMSNAKYFNTEIFNQDKVLHTKRFTEFDQFEDLLNNTEFSDVVFNINDQKIHAHKNILSNRCPVFKAMFQHDMEENKKNEVRIEDIEYEVLKELLRYVYAGRVNNLSTIAYKLLIAADKYSLETLKELCETALCNDLTVHNAITYLQLADTYTVQILKCKTIEFIVTHRQLMKKMPTFMQIGDMSSDIINTLILSLIDTPSSTL